VAVILKGYASRHQLIFSENLPVSSLISLNEFNPKNGVSLADVPMLIDTGSDVSLVPRTCAEQLDASIDPEQIYELMSFDGEVSQTVAVEVDLSLLNRTFKGLYLLTGDDVGVLGRDILNFIALVIDGPQLTWTDYRPVAAKK
jgi:hypothetical protein